MIIKLKIFRSCESIPDETGEILSVTEDQQKNRKTMRILLIVLIVIVVLIGGVSIMMIVKNQKTPENLGV
ncbi:MAG: hypothetical protein MJE63_21600, partial [Proteobacteria bacterium]|nr:hypothetical protein [Pseudomonadota bacterium]